MAGKQIMLYPAIVASTIWIVMNIINIKANTDELKNNYPECTKSNPGALNIFISTISVLIITQIPCGKFFSK